MQERFVENKGSFWRPDILNIQADPNLFLSDGKPNPDFGRPFVQTDAYGARSRVNQRSARATFAWTPDLTRRAGWLRHLGRYTVAGLYEVWSSENKAQNFRLSTYDQQNWMTAAQYNNGLVADRLLAVRYYLGDSKQRTKPSFASGIIDFQDAVLGPAAYDLVSLLQDARIDVPEALELSLFGRYLKARQATEPGFDPAAFARTYAIMSAQRNTRLLGTFARLNRRDGKPHYLKHQPRIWAYLARSLAHPALAEFRRWYEAHVPPPL